MEQDSTFWWLLAFWITVGGLWVAGIGIHHRWASRRDRRDHNRVIEQSNAVFDANFKKATEGIDDKPYTPRPDEMRDDIVRDTEADRRRRERHADGWGDDLPF